MTGVYADNQPDFTWLKPYEEKTFTQYFMPYKHVGRVKNATKDAAIGMDLSNGKCIIKAYTSGVFADSTIIVKNQGGTLFTDQADLTPERFYEASFHTELADLSGVTATIYDSGMFPLVTYEAVTEELEPTPDPADPLLSPQELKTTEELYLGAQHLEQYRHATLNPEDYYLEGLRRDPSDIRLNNGYGLLLYRRGNFEESIRHFNKAIEKQTWKNPNPYYGESYFNLGLALVMTGDDKGAYDAFYKSTWSYETQGAGYYWLACLSVKRGDYRNALEFIDNALIR